MRFCFCGGGGAAEAAEPAAAQGVRRLKSRKPSRRGKKGAEEEWERESSQPSEAVKITNLHEAAFYGDAHKVRKFFHKGESPTTIDDAGQTALHLAGEALGSGNSSSEGRAGGGGWCMRRRAAVGGRRLLLGRRLQGWPAPRACRSK